MSNVFAKIVRGEIPADIVYQDQQVTAFRDVDPVAPVHILIVPNKEIASLDDLEQQDQVLAGKMLLVAQMLARQEGVAEDGYRLVINSGPHGGQEVAHLHLHLLGGRPLGPMVRGG